MLVESEYLFLLASQETVIMLYYYCYRVPTLYLSHSVTQDSLYSLQPNCHLLELFSTFFLSLSTFSGKRLNIFKIYSIIDFITFPSCDRCVVIPRLFTYFPLGHLQCHILFIFFYIDLIKSSDTFGLHDLPQYHLLAKL